MKVLFKFILIVSYLVNTAIADISNTTCKKYLKIGVSIPLSAGAISSGKAVMNSIILADEKYDYADCVKFIFEDDQLLAKNTVSIVNKFIKIDNVDGLIIYGTRTSIAVGNIVEQSRVPMIALSILKKVVNDKRYIMKHWCTAESLNKAIGQEVGKRGYKSVAIVSSQNDAMLGLRDLYLDSKFTKVTSDEEFVREHFDFRATILKIRSRTPDAVYILLYPPQTGIFVKQLREQGFNREIFGVHNIEDPGEVKSSAGGLIGAWLANGDDSVGENYHADYLNRFKVETSLGGASGYDVAKMYIELATQDGNLNEQLHSLRNFKGAFGTYNATNENDFDFQAVIKEVTKTGFTKLATHSQ